MGSSESKRFRGDFESEDFGNVSSHRVQDILRISGGIFCKYFGREKPCRSVHISLAGVGLRKSSKGTFPDDDCYDHNLVILNVLTRLTLVKRGESEGGLPETPDNNDYPFYLDLPGSCVKTIEVFCEMSPRCFPFGFTGPFQIENGTRTPELACVRAEGHKGDRNVQSPSCTRFLRNNNIPSKITRRSKL
ncbi:hypothetical protein CROQUDRAFT_100701 [Cronartium quercuum f. sp. fusiforme G11]|uniref:Uncharacterized protein n=1 Tax=Cronartium quercuum f. sp. fusiforme G11 TaxID=708437 RepID=A0A9P6N9A4_9BASI|nr:hypothetical protein CROQUDRAFT_100701 [Cronartium quercuum f. sp. fusiforme G11]